MSANSQRVPLRRAWAGLVILLAGAMACSGPARSDRKPVYPVVGKVLVDGQPARQARVVFVPVGSANDQTPRPNGGVRADGTFELSTYDARDGAPEGQYLVSIQWRLPDKDDPNELGPGLLQGRYVDHNRSGLKVTVQPTPNTLAPFELTGKSR